MGGAVRALLLPRGRSPAAGGAAQATETIGPRTTHEVRVRTRRAPRPDGAPHREFVYRGRETGNPGAALSTPVTTCGALGPRVEPRPSSGVAAPCGSSWCTRRRGTCRRPRGVAVGEGIPGSHTLSSGVRPRRCTVSTLLGLAVAWRTTCSRRRTPSVTTRTRSRGRSQVPSVQPVGCPVSQQLAVAPLRAGAGSSGPKSPLGAAAEVLLPASFGVRVRRSRSRASQSLVR